MFQPPRNDPTIDIGPVGPDGESRGEPVRPRGRLRRNILTALTAIVVGAVAVLGWVGWQMVSEKDAVLTTPDAIGALRLDRSDDGNARTAQLREELAAAVDLDTAVAAVYLDGTGRNVLFLAGTRSFWAPESVLNSVLDAITDTDGTLLEHRYSVNAGPLGGTMKCAKAKTIRGDATVCGWADHGSLAVATFADRDEPESANLLRQIRSATQTRS
jgi:hypothetical protein